MEFKIINPTGESYLEQVGITHERALELNRELDILLTAYAGSQVRLCDIFHDISLFCKNLAEYTYCTVIHSNWWYKQGVIIDMNKRRGQSDLYLETENSF